MFSRALCFALVCWIALAVAADVSAQDNPFDLRQVLRAHAALTGGFQQTGGRHILFLCDTYLANLVGLLA